MIFVLDFKCCCPYLFSFITRINAVLSSRDPFWCSFCRLSQHLRVSNTDTLSDFVCFSDPHLLFPERKTASFMSTSSHCLLPPSPQIFGDSDTLHFQHTHSLDSRNSENHESATPKRGPSRSLRSNPRICFPTYKIRSIPSTRICLPPSMQWPTCPKYRRLTANGGPLNHVLPITVGRHTHRRRML